MDGRDGGGSIAGIARAELGATASAAVAQTSVSGREKRREASMSGLLAVPESGAGLGSARFVVCADSV